MLISRLNKAVSVLCKINRSTCLMSQRNIKQQSSKNDDPEDKPISYSSTPAATWKAEFSRMPPDERVWYTPFVVSGSVAIFMIYFCILREENDIDEFIYRPLPETIKGIEQLYPDVDFNTKPDYVLYHENERKKKNQIEMERKSESLNSR